MDRIWTEQGMKFGPELKKRLLEQHRRELWERELRDVQRIARHYSPKIFIILWYIGRGIIERILHKRFIN